MLLHCFMGTATWCGLLENMPLPLLLLLLPLHVMANLAVIFLYVLRGQPGPVLRKSTRFAWFALRVAPACQRSAFDDDGPSLARTG